MIYVRFHFSHLMGYDLSFVVWLRKYLLEEERNSPCLDCWQQAEKHFLAWL